MVTASKPYGCHNRQPYRPDMLVQDGHWWPDESTRHPRMVKVPFRMANDCQYTKSELGKNDAKCTGCKHKEPHADESN